MNAACRRLQSSEERSAAQAIVERLYAAQGYDMSSSDFARYLQGSAATTFGLFEHDTLYGTISIILDGEAGLPMDAIYREELAPRRAQGRKLAEVVQFVLDPEIFFSVTGKKPSPFEALPLFAAVLSQAIEAQVDDLCISINPKHDRFYSLLGFEQIGDLKHYGSVQAPAIARCLAVARAAENLLIAHFLAKA